MDKEKQIQNLIQGLPSPKANQEFKYKLAEKLDKKANELDSFEDKSKKSVLFPWKLGLTFTSIIFFLLISITIFSSPETRKKISGYIKQEAQSAFSDISIVTLSNIDKQESTIFVYDLLEEDKPPLDIVTRQKKDAVEILLYPGYYKIIIINEGEPTIQKNIVIEKDEKSKIVNFKNIDKNG